MWNRLTGNSPAMILLLGPDNAGKTSLLGRLTPTYTDTSPILGFAFERVEYQNLTILSWDLVSSSRLWPLYKHYFQLAKAIIYMVDSYDRDRIDEVREDLDLLLSQEELKGVVLLVLGNKQDLPGAMGYQELEERLELRRIRGRQWRLQLCCMLSLEGMEAGWEWLSAVMARKASIVLP